MNFTKNSVLDPIDKKNPPEGLYALVLTAVCVNWFFASEFLFLYFNLKGWTRFCCPPHGCLYCPPHFNHENCWKPLEDFLENLDKIKESRWKTILQFHKIDDDDDTAANDHEKNADRSMISACRAGMYIPSSPLKAWSFAFDVTYHFRICSTPLFHGSLGLLEYI